MRKLKTSLDAAGLARYVARQLNHGFPDDSVVAQDALLPAIGMALDRVEHCFSHVENRYFFDGEASLFNHLNGDQYAMFLYLLSNAAYRMGIGESLPAKLFLLNKNLHGIDAYYEVELPSVFLFVHPLATVLGRATYGEFFLVYQRCGVGSNHDVYPTLGHHVTLRPGSSVLGRCRVGSNATIAAESLLLDRDLEADSVYIGNPRDCFVRPATGAAAIWRRSVLSSVSPV